MPLLLAVTSPWFLTLKHATQTRNSSVASTSSVAREFADCRSCVTPNSSSISKAKAARNCSRVVRGVTSRLSCPSRCRCVSRPPQHRRCHRWRQQGSLRFRWAIGERAANGRPALVFGITLRFHHPVHLTHRLRQLHAQPDPRLKSCPSARQRGASRLSQPVKSRSISSASLIAASTSCSMESSP